MVLGFLSSVENVTHKKPANVKHSKKRKSSKEESVATTRVQEASVTNSIEDMKPTKIHTILCNIDQRMQLLETYIADMVKTETPPVQSNANFTLLPPPIVSVPPPSIVPVPPLSPPTVSVPPPPNISVPSPPHLNGSVPRPPHLDGSVRSLMSTSTVPISKVTTSSSEPINSGENNSLAVGFLQELKEKVKSRRESADSMAVI
jgi:hypothetical protein